MKRRRRRKFNGKCLCGKRIPAAAVVVTRPDDKWRSLYWCQCGRGWCRVSAKEMELVAGYWPHTRAINRQQMKDKLARECVR